MTELPGTFWRDEPWARNEALHFAPMPAKWRPAGMVRHGFTHFGLTISLFAACVPRIDAEGFVRPIETLPHEAMSSVMRKCVRMVQGAGQHESLRGAMPR
jgi:A/G-specific adenine glycosylase